MKAHDESTEAAPASFVVLGARGSIPVSGARFDRFGGNTTSFAIEQNGITSTLVDAGTGINAYDEHGLVLSNELSVFLTHYHWDHIQGLSMLGDMWGGDCVVEVWGSNDPEASLTGAIRPPWFPVLLADQTNVLYRRLGEGLVRRGSVGFTPFAVNHPGGALGYRIEGPDEVVLVITDHEHAHGVRLDVPEGDVNTVIFDGQYLPSEMDRHRGWGHSSWEDAVAFAIDVDADRLVITSHDPDRSDDAVDALVAAAQRLFPATEAAYPGLRIPL
ncbi:MAG: MBL fold metallo-hydrolase [Proteobacteria bacterium]|nr:MBL fold metallo-hydrolase [Pseudomonadota bacterium]